MVILLVVVLVVAVTGADAAADACVVRLCWSVMVFVHVTEKANKNRLFSVRKNDDRTHTRGLGKHEFWSTLRKYIRS